MRLSGRSTARRLTPGAPVQNPSHPGRVLLRFEENPGFDVGESRFRCRSTASVRKGAEPEHLRTRGGCSYRSRRIPVLMQENLGLGVGAPPPVRTRFGCRSTALGAKRVSSQSTFAPGAGAPTVRGEPPVLM